MNWKGSNHCLNFPEVNLYFIPGIICIVLCTPTHTSNSFRSIHKDSQFVYGSHLPKTYSYNCKVVYIGLIGTRSLYGWTQWLLNQPQVTKDSCFPFSFAISIMTSAKESLMPTRCIDHSYLFYFTS